MDLMVVGWRCYSMRLRRETAVVAGLIPPPRRDWVCLRRRRMLRADRSLSPVVVVQLVRNHSVVMLLPRMDWDCLQHLLGQRRAWKLVRRLAEMPVQTLTVRKQALLPSERAGRNRYSGPELTAVRTLRHQYREQKAVQMRMHHHQEQKVVRMQMHQLQEQKVVRMQMHQLQEQKAGQMLMQRHLQRMSGQIQSFVLDSRVVQTLNLRHQWQKPDRNQVVRACRRQRLGRT
jgi:hypothetical protein